MKKRLVAFLLVLIMVLGMLPVSAFAADDGVSPQALESNETQTIKYQILYVGDEFNTGYNYGVSVNKTYTCQYSEPHSGYNHSILCSEIKNVGVPALKGQLDSGYEFVGWAKEAKKNPTIYDFNTAGTTATQTTYTIYLVAKKTNPTPTYMYYLYYKYNDGTDSTWLTDVTDRPTAATTFTFNVNRAKLTRSGYDHIGWADKADAVTAKYTGGDPIVLTKDNPTKTIYAIWMPFFELKYDANGGTGAPASQTRTAAHPTVNRVTFTVPNQTPSKEGYTFKGWADSAAATTAQYQPGGTVDVKHENSPKTVYAVWEGSDPIPVPSYDDLKSAIGQIQVKDVSTPSCGTENYDLIDNTQSEPFNWTKTARLDQPGKYDVTIKTAPYVAKYNSEKSKTHELNNANQTTLKLVISYENNTWKLDDGLRVIEVKHSEQTPPTDKPAKPTENDVTGVIVDIVCVTTTGTHDTVQYPLGYPTDAQHTIGEVVSDGAGGYICPVTVRTAWFVQQASNLVWKVQHTPTAQTITFNLTYDKNSKTWVKPAANPRIEATHEVTPDTPGDQKPNIEEANAKIRVQCIEYPSKHNPYKQNYRILPGSYEDLGWDRTEYGYIYSIRLNRAKYIAQFDQEIGRPHTDTEPNKETRINWRWENGAWHLIDGPDGIDADIKVKCDQTETPPTKPIITGRQEYIRVICKNEPNKERNYVPKFGRYTESDPAVQKVNGVWTYTITILRDKHVEEFNKDFPGHEDTDPNAVTTMSWVWKDAEWKLVPVNGLRTVGAIIEVTCKPKAPTADELKKLDMAVQVKCVVDAAQQHTDAYGLLGEYDEDYFVGEPRKDGDDWLCDISYDPELYVAEFNKTFPNPKHVQNDEKIVPVTLIWAGGSWQIKTQGRVHVTEEYTVTYTDGVENEEVFADQVYSDLRKDSTTPAFNGTPTRTGYTFAGWEPEVAATVTQTVTYVAKWEAKKANVHLMIFKSGDLSKPIVDVPYAADKLAGDTIDLTKIDPSSYLDFDFEIDGGWYDDGMFNSYKRYLDGLQDKPAGLEKLLITGNWQNLKLIVTELVPVVYFDSLESLTAYQNDHSKTEGILRTTKARVGSALPTADAPTATRDGYTFTFWSREGQTVDVTGQTVNGWTNLYANWEKKTFTVKYYLPDETGAWVEKKMDTVDSVDYATYSLWTPNAEDGYEFSGWYQKVADIGVKAKVEKLYMAKEWKLYGKFTPIEYTIQYVYNDGKATSTNPTTYTVESDTITLADATGADWGKTFLEWHDENGQKITEIPTGSTGDRVITAYWNWPVHLHYLDKDNNEIESATLYVSELEPGACVLPTGEKTGYDFDGWYEAKKDIGTASHKLNALSIAKKWELYGRYTAKTDVSYTVKYLREGDNKVLAPEKVVTDQTFDTEVTEQAADVVGYTPDAPSKTMILDEYNKVLTFSYSANTYDYTVRHIKQLPDGSYDEANAEVETLSGKFEALAAVTAKDYGSHYPTNDADTKQNIKIEKGLTIDVKYDLDEHTLTFETNGGSAINPVTVRHGNAVARPADPTKDKYTFIGWYADPEFTEEYDFATVLEADKTIYAKFELTSTPIGDIYVRYDVLHIKQLPDGTYDLANAEVEHLSAKKDTTVTAVIKDYRATHHVNVNRTLSKLTGTAIQPYKGVDGKPVYTILSVYYDLDFHTLTFDTMGGSKIAPETVRHGLTVAKPKDPVNGGYIFDGWYTDKTFRHRYDFSTPLTEDITIYAKWFLIVLPGVTVKKNTPKLNTADHFAYVQGYPDGTVKPAGNITRAETAAILFRLMDDASRKTYYSTKSGFRDVASGSWYNTYVATLNNAGVITDSSNGCFRPNEAITRAELAAMLAKFSETTGAANYFNDVSASYWAANAIAICAKLGWINGYPDGTFRPDKNVTRAELMAMINRATGRAPKSADAFLPGMKTWIDNTSDKWYYLDVQEATNSHSYTVKGSETWTALTSDPNWSLYE